MFFRMSLEEENPVAQLLMVDARLRANRLVDAGELLRSITAERIAFPLDYPYAMTCALWHSHATTLI